MDNDCVDTGPSFNREVPGLLVYCRRHHGANEPSGWSFFSIRMGVGMETYTVGWTTPTVGTTVLKDSPPTFNITSATLQIPGGGTGDFVPPM